MFYNLAQLQDLFRQAGWPENLIEKASAVSMYESSGNPNAHNPRGEDSWGLMQINWPYHREYDRARLVEPIYNLQAAYAIYRREGWRAWYNSNLKYNRDYLGIASQARAIYNNTSVGNSPVTIIADTTTNTDQTVTTNTNEDDTGLYVILGITALLLLT